MLLSCYSRRTIKRPVVVSFDFLDHCSDFTSRENSTKCYCDFNFRCFRFDDKLFMYKLRVKVVFHFFIHASIHRICFFFVTFYILKAQLTRFGANRPYPRGDPFVSIHWRQLNAICFICFPSKFNYFHHPKTHSLKIVDSGANPFFGALWTRDNPFVHMLIITLSVWWRASEIISTYWVRGASQTVITSEKIFIKAMFTRRFLYG